MILKIKPSRTYRWFKISTLLAATIALGACASSDDFGRTRSNIFTDKIVPLTRTAIHEVRGIATSDYELTNSESQMRTYGEALRKNGRGEEVMSAVMIFSEKLGLMEADHELDRAEAHNAGVTAFERREQARKPGQILVAIDEDYRLSKAFGRSAEEVYRDDWKRLQYLARSPDVNSTTNINVIGRARENRRIVLRTHRMMINRIDEYRLEVRDSLLRYPRGNKNRLYSEINRLAALIDEMRLSIRPLGSPGRPPEHTTSAPAYRGTTSPKHMVPQDYKTAHNNN